MMDAIRRFLTLVGVRSAHPLAFLIASTYGLLVSLREGDV